ncbi:MAG: sugar phosphate isomerase/epimerase [Ruminococcaceae bacterium]|nr:sugar phosphate isomerase/epimerase [Oscillospiraceae bacterium]
MKVGAMLYNLRDYCKTPEEVSRSLEKVAAMGYRAVQICGLCPCDPAWLRAELDRNGLYAPLTHYKYLRVLEETDTVIAEHDTLGCDYVGIGCLVDMFVKGEADYVQEVRERVAKKFVKDAKPMVRKIRDAGKLFMYHNHDVEYNTRIGDETIMEYFARSFSPDELGFTLDVYWVQAAGVDVVEEIKRYAGRLPCVHLKDMTFTEEGTRRYTWCGDGVMDFDKIGAALVEAGTKYAFVEQDCTYPDEPDPFVCLEKSYRHLKSLGFEF